jgi:hypothetical protein
MKRKQVSGARGTEGDLLKQRLKQHGLKLKLPTTRGRQRDNKKERLLHTTIMN